MILELFIDMTVVYFTELLTDFSYTNVTVSYCILYSLYRCIGQTPCSVEHYLVVYRFVLNVFAHTTLEESSMCRKSDTVYMIIWHNMLCALSTHLFCLCM